MNARRRWLSRVSWMISRARTGRVAPPHATPGPEMSRLGADGRRPLAAASEYLLPARRERDLVVELRRHAVVAAGLLAGCMLFGGARVRHHPRNRPLCLWVIWPKPLELLEVVFYSVCRFCAQRAVWVWAQVWARGRFPSRNGLQRRERRHGGDYDDDSGDRARSKRFRRPPRRGTLCAATIWMVLSVDQDG